MATEGLETTIPPAPAFLAKLRGDGMAVPPRAPAKAIALAWLGGVLAISAVAALTLMTNQPLVLGSFGATCVLAFGFPDSPFSQPRNIILGHVLSSAVGLACLMAFGNHWWAVGIAAGTAIAVMMATRTVHPPAGSNPVIVFLSQPGWSFLLYPTLAGVLIVALVVFIYNNLVRASPYPKYW